MVDPVPKRLFYPAPHPTAGDWASIADVAGKENDTARTTAPLTATSFTIMGRLPGMLDHSAALAAIAITCVGACLLWLRAEETCVFGPCSAQVRVTPDP